MTDINLKQFCGDDPFRPYISEPFRRDGFVYATNGHILVRVADDERYHQVTKIDPAKVLAGFDERTFLPPPAVRLPPPKPAMSRCPTCAGRGHLHDCPDCDCECDTCGGTGSGDLERITSTTLGGAYLHPEVRSPTPFAAKPATRPRARQRRRGRPPAVLQVRRGHRRVDALPRTASRTHRNREQVGGDAHARPQ